jgi:hypothetical protein
VWAPSNDICHYNPLVIIEPLRGARFILFGQPEKRARPEKYPGLAQKLYYLWFSEMHLRE